MRYRKKPVVIEATQWWKNGDHPEDGAVALSASPVSFTSVDHQLGWEGQVVRYYRLIADSGASECSKCSKPMYAHGWIDTFEGGHVVCPGDWIITGVEGERYPVKDAIFRKTYEVVEGPA